MKTALPGDLEIVPLEEVTGKMPKSYSPLVIVTPFDDDPETKDYKWTVIRDAVGVKSNVPNARWMPEKITPLFQNLDAPARLTDNGRPTKFGAQVLYRYNVYCNRDGKSYESFCAAYREVYPPKQVVQDVIYPEILPDEDENSSGKEAASGLVRYQAKVLDGYDDLDGKIAALMQLSAEVEQLDAEYEEAEDRDFELQIAEDELKKCKEELKRKKREKEIRLGIRKKAGLA